MHEDRLRELRGEIDVINLQILELLTQRAQVVSAIGLVQQTLGTSFYDPEREAEMLTRLQQANEGPFSNETISALFNQIFRASLALEEEEALAKILVQRHYPDERTVIAMADGTEVGAGDFTVISGPCAIESAEQVDEVAGALAARGVRFLRGMGWKPRTSPYDFQGLGMEGLRIARQVANRHNMFIVSEVMDKSLISEMSEYVDVFWVGARNMSNTFLLKALGQVRQPVILKRSFGANIQEFLYAAEYIVSNGNPNVILMERGIRTFETRTRNTLDLSAVALLKLETHLPVVADISHSAGRRDIAIPLARATKAVGADGVMFECHPNPPVAMSDAKQQLSIPEMHALLDEIMDEQKVLA